MNNWLTRNAHPASEGFFIAAYIRKRKERNKQKKLEDQYKGPYEIAVINNVTKRMKEIEDIVGYAPGRKGPGSGSSKRNGKVLYTHFNPHPCSGGRFSPK